MQVVNHGILEGMLEGVGRFMEQDVEMKKQYYTRDLAKRKVSVDTNFDPTAT